MVILLINLSLRLQVILILFDFDLLTQMGLLKESDYASVNFGDDPTSVDYERIFSARRPILETAVETFF